MVDTPLLYIAILLFIASQIIYIEHKFKWRIFKIIPPIVITSYFHKLMDLQSTTWKIKYPKLASKNVWNGRPILPIQIQRKEYFLSLPQPQWKILKAFPLRNLGIIKGSSP